MPTQLLLASIALDENDLRAEAHANILQLLVSKEVKGREKETATPVMSASAHRCSTSEPPSSPAAAPTTRRSTNSSDRRRKGPRVASGEAADRRHHARTRPRGDALAQDQRRSGSDGHGVPRRTDPAYLAEKKNDEARQIVAKARDFASQKVEEAKAKSLRRRRPGQSGDAESQEQKTLKKAVEDQETLVKAVADLEELLLQQKLTPAGQYDAAVARINKEQKERRSSSRSPGDLARRYQKVDEAEKQYKQAEEEATKAKSDGLDAVQKLYTLLMENRRYNDAKPYLAKLVTARTPMAERASRWRQSTRWLRATSTPPSARRPP